MRNALIILTKILPHYPKLTGFCSALEKRVEKIKQNEKDKRQDIYTLASVYLGQLRQRKPQMLEESKFHLKEVPKEKIKSSQIQSIIPFDKHTTGQSVNANGVDNIKKITSTGTTVASSNTQDDKIKTALKQANATTTATNSASNGVSSTNKNNLTSNNQEPPNKQTTTLNNNTTQSNSNSASSNTVTTNATNNSNKAQAPSSQISSSKTSQVSDNTKKQNETNAKAPL